MGRIDMTSNNTFTTITFEQALVDLPGAPGMPGALVGIGDTLWALAQSDRAIGFVVAGIQAVDGIRSEADSDQREGPVAQLEDLDVDEAIAILRFAVAAGARGESGYVTINERCEAIVEIYDDNDPESDHGHFSCYRDAYDAARAAAIRTGSDIGIERSGEGYLIYPLPRPSQRSGHELRCEVVSPGSPRISR